MEAATKKYEDRVRRLVEDCQQANGQVESLRQLTSQQNEQLGMLKRQTEAAIRAREEANQEVRAVAVDSLSYVSCYAVPAT